MIDQCVCVSSLVLNVPAWFREEGFVEWLNDPNNNVMTWHQAPRRPNEWSDVVVLVDPQINGEGSNSDMPAKYWDQIVGSCRDAGLVMEEAHIPVRLVNV